MVKKTKSSVVSCEGEPTVFLDLPAEHNVPPTTPGTSAAQPAADARESSKLESHESTTSSPYACKPVAIECGPSRITYWLPKHLLRSPKWSTTDAGGRIRLRDVSAATGHTLVHYLYTGTYQALEAKEEGAATPAHIKFKQALLTFILASTHELPDLERLAKKQIGILGSCMALVEVLNTAEKEFSKLTWSWFHEYLQDRAKEQFDLNHTFFTSRAFIESIGEGTLHKFMTCHLLKTFSEKLTNTLQRRESRRNKEELDAVLVDVEGAAVRIDHCPCDDSEHQTASDDMSFDFLDVPKEVDDAISLDNSVCDETPLTLPEFEPIQPPEIEPPAGSEPEPVPESSPVKEEEEAELKKKEEEEAAAAAAASTSADFTWADPAANNDDWGSFAPTTGKKKKGKKGALIEESVPEPVPEPEPTPAEPEKKEEDDPWSFTFGGTTKDKKKKKKGAIEEIPPPPPDPEPPAEPEPAPEPEPAKEEDPWASAAITTGKKKKGKKGKEEPKIEEPPPPPEPEPVAEPEPEPETPAPEPVPESVPEEPAVDPFAGLSKSQKKKLQDKMKKEAKEAAAKADADAAAQAEEDAKRKEEEDVAAALAAQEAEAEAEQLRLEEEEAEKKRMEDEEAAAAAAAAEAEKKKDDDWGGAITTTKKKKKKKGAVEEEPPPPPPPPPKKKKAKSAEIDPPPPPPELLQIEAAVQEPDAVEEPNLDGEDDWGSLAPSWGKKKKDPKRDAPVEFTEDTTTPVQKPDEDDPWGSAEFNIGKKTKKSKKGLATDLLSSPVEQEPELPSLKEIEAPPPEEDDLWAPRGLAPVKEKKTKKGEVVEEPLIKTTSRESASKKDMVEDLISLDDPPPVEEKKEKNESKSSSTFGSVFGVSLESTKKETAEKIPKKETPTEKRVRERRERKEREEQERLDLAAKEEEQGLAQEAAAEQARIEAEEAEAVAARIVVEEAEAARIAEEEAARIAEEEAEAARIAAEAEAARSPVSFKDKKKKKKKGVVIEEDPPPPPPEAEYDDPDAALFDLVKDIPEDRRLAELGGDLKTELIPKTSSTLCPWLSDHLLEGDGWKSCERCSAMLREIAIQLGKGNKTVLL